MPDLTHLDSQALRTFRENDVAGFISNLDKIQKDDPAGVQAVKSIAEGRTTPDTLWYAGTSSHPPVAIGLMGAEDTVHGQTLLKSIMTAASSVAGILDTQQKLFANIDRNLGETVDTLLKNQGDTLESIGAEKMLDAFADTGRSAVTGQPTGSVGGVTLPSGTV
ncbi:type VII secretion system-associated protein [Streptomyces zhihengii]|uniref:Type VII secretion system-associated protein n=1 Tax=Streptomyces zhihengii TaxID=1818004 RepID=A0ABS2V468_9ACTN|nr:type VII secretion system-associated protein [Streptomyces zhihengii]MBM9624503.1 type VII secretion system-associated protein [Streptomyces zhihengii]